MVFKVEQGGKVWWAWLLSKRDVVEQVELTWSGDLEKRKSPMMANAKKWSGFSSTYKDI